LIVVDASALIAILKHEPEQAQFRQILLDAPEVQMAAPTKFELMMVAHGLKLGDTQPLALSLLVQANIRVVAWSDALADAAFDAFLHYGKGQHPAKLNFGDCMSYALAKSLDAPLLYKGDDFAKTDIKSAATASA
jgi:ribonuclease VapC